jgi:ubiquinone/menaquinone biosynthesis C-methylase UbiE
MTNYLTFTPDWNPDAIAAYDELPLWSAMAGLLLLEHLPLQPNATVLDVGFGTGFPLLELAQRLGPTSTVVGIDPWRPALTRARLKQQVWQSANAHIVLADAVAMPLADARFDLVVSNLGLNNFDDAPAAIAECARVLKPGGRIAITTNLQGHMQEFYEAFAATLTRLGLTDAAKALQRHVEHRTTIASVHALFENAGLTIIRTEQRTLPMRFASGTALLNHHLIKIGFLSAWKSVVPDEELTRTFEALEKRLNEQATAAGELRLTIPLAYVEARRS